MCIIFFSFANLNKYINQNLIVSLHLIYIIALPFFLLLIIILCFFIGFDDNNERREMRHAALLLLLGKALNI